MCILYCCLPAASSLIWESGASQGFCLLNKATKKASVSSVLAWGGIYQHVGNMNEAQLHNSLHVLLVTTFFLIDFLIWNMSSICFQSFLLCGLKDQTNWRATIQTEPKPDYQTMWDVQQVPNYGMKKCVDAANGCRHHRLNQVGDLLHLKWDTQAWLKPPINSPTALVQTMTMLERRKKTNCHNHSFFTREQFLAALIISR